MHAYYPVALRQHARRFGDAQDVIVGEEHNLVNKGPCAIAAVRRRRSRRPTGEELVAGGALRNAPVGRATLATSNATHHYS